MVLKKRECCVLKSMCTFSSSAQHDIVYLYYDVSTKCAIRVVGYIIGYKVQCNVHLEIIMTAIVQVHNWINSWYMVNSIYKLL